MAPRKNVNKTKRKKFNAVKVTIDGIVFDSQIEGKFYQQLSKLHAEGKITSLMIHPSWELQPKLTEKYVKHLKTKDMVCERAVLQPIIYTADFSFFVGDRQIVLDVKGSRKFVSRDFPLRAKMLRYKYGLEVHVVTDVKELEQFITE